MKIAVPVWENRVSPVLDTADRIRIFEASEGTIVSNREVFIGGKTLFEVAHDICDNADVLICAALSRSLESCLLSAGLEIHPWFMGDAERLVEMFAEGSVPGPEYFMPGCRGNRYAGQPCGRRHGKRHGYDNT